MTRTLCILLAVGAVGLTAQSAAAASRPLPFVGTYSGTAAFTSETTVSLSGNGVATLIGRSANEGRIVITGPATSTCPGGLANIHTDTLTAANGDSLTFVAHDVGCPIEPGVFHGTGSWVITGGTGRFDGASGQGTVRGRADFNEGRFRFTLTGTIRAPGRS
jgi:hypothetical protein